MTIDLNGITNEQLRLERSKVRYDLENLEPGTGCWTSSEAVWADVDGSVFIELTHPQNKLEEVEHATDSEIGWDDPDDYVYVFYAVEGYIVSVTHITDYQPKGITTPKQSLRRNSQPVIGIIYEDVSLDYLNSEFIKPVYGVDIPTLPIDIDTE